MKVTRSSVDASYTAQGGITPFTSFLPEQTSSQQKLNLQCAIRNLRSFSDATKFIDAVEKNESMRPQSWKIRCRFPVDESLLYLLFPNIRWFGRFVKYLSQRGNTTRFHSFSYCVFVFSFVNVLIRGGIVQHISTSCPARHVM